MTNQEKNQGKNPFSMVTLGNASPQSVFMNLLNCVNNSQLSCSFSFQVGKEVGVRKGTPAHSFLSQSPNFSDVCIGFSVAFLDINFRCVFLGFIFVCLFIYLGFFLCVCVYVCILWRQLDKGPGYVFVKKFWGLI